MMPILYLTNEELAERIKSREKAPDVPFDAFEFQRRYRLKFIEAREDRLLVLWASLALLTGLLLLLARSMSIKQAVRLMQLCDDEGVVHYPQVPYLPGVSRQESISTALDRIGITAEQAAKAARRLGWTSDTPEDWPELKRTTTFQ